MSGDTPLGAPSGSRPVTRRKLLRLMPARSTPVGASAATAAGDGAGSGLRAQPTTRRSGGRRARRSVAGGGDAQALGALEEGRLQLALAEEGADGGEHHGA